MNNEKLCESAYLAAKDQHDRCHLHGAGMAVRTAEATHFYLVRGGSSDSVVHVLHRQLIKAGRLPKGTISVEQGKANSRLRQTNLDHDPKKNNNTKRSGSAVLGTPLLVTLFIGMVAIIWGWLHAAE